MVSIIRLLVESFITNITSVIDYFSMFSLNVITQLTLPLKYGATLITFMINQDSLSSKLMLEIVHNPFDFTTINVDFTTTTFPKTMISIKINFFFL